MKDYEQLYYDSQYEIKKLHKKIELIEQELDIYKSQSKSSQKSIKSIIVTDFSNYLVKKRGK